MKKIIFLVVIGLAGCGMNSHKSDSVLDKTGREDSVKVVEMNRDTNLVVEKPAELRTTLRCSFPEPSIKLNEKDSLKSELTEVDTSKVYTAVDQMPEFPGCEEELLKFVQNNLRQPSIGDDLVPQGKVICRFIIDIDGSVIKPEVIRSLDREMDAEALRVIRLLPKFIPGKQNGKNVRVWYTIPVTFRIDG